MDDNICCPDTSFLISLLDNLDDNHNIAVKEFKKVRFGDLYILQPVKFEFLNIANREYNKIVNFTLIEIEKSASSAFKIQDINSFINIGKEQFKKKYPHNNIKKIENLTTKIYNDIKNYYSRRNSNINENNELKISKKHLINYFYDCIDKFSFHIIGIISVLKELGHSNFTITKIANDKIDSIKDEYLKLQNSYDNNILIQFILFALSNPESLFTLYLFDKEFAKIAEKYIEQLECQNAKIKLINN
ncbi:MAG: PIN domain-containing protein [bacterium]